MIDPQSITATAVHQALRAIRYALPQARNPLLQLAAVTALLRAEGLADVPRCREWTLGCLLRRTAWQELRRVGATVKLPGEPGVADDACLLRSAAGSSTPA